MKNNICLKNHQVFCVALCLIVLGGCASQSSVYSKREGVFLATGTQNKSCKYLKSIDAVERNGDNHRRYMDEEHLKRDVINILKDKVLGLKGNTLVITKRNISYRNAPRNTLVDEMSMTGKAYLCS